LCVCGPHPCTLASFPSVFHHTLFLHTVGWCTLAGTPPPTAPLQRRFVGRDSARAPLHTAFHPLRIGRPVSQPTSHHRQPSSARVRSRTDPTQPRRKSVEKGTWLAANTKPPFSAPSQTERRNNNKIGRYRAQAQGWACCGRSSVLLSRIFPRASPRPRSSKKEGDLDKWHQHSP